MANGSLKIGIVYHPSTNTIISLYVILPKPIIGYYYSRQLPVSPFSKQMEMILIRA